MSITAKYRQDYKERRKLMVNRLVNETSPYLKQHAHNPVDWFPWGKEAFEEAKKRDIPIFLSIGYSTCHWCHVMEEESFDNEKIACLINKNFIPVKVDREERPDIDSFYMKVCQQMTGSGGWPLTIFLKHDKKPFFAATYLPAESKYGRKGLIDLIPEIVGLWQNDREKIFEVAEKIMNSLSDKKAKSTSEFTGDNLLDNAFSILKQSYDEKMGGFGSSPKFPMPGYLKFLLFYWYKYSEPSALDMVENSLIAMRLGGIYDQLEYGFHRYAVDRNWETPHFEKMLYDQALLLEVYSITYQITGKEIYMRTAKEIISYLKSVLVSKEGCFYTAEDADSEGEEGKYYLWSRDELKQKLSKKNYKKTISLYQINKPNSTLRFSEVNDIKKADKLKRKLLQIRQKRTRPNKDDKILVDWNSLTSAALAGAGKIFNEKEFIEMAENIVEFIWDNRNAKGRLFHSYCEGQYLRKDNLDDYSFLLHALIELHQATLNSIFLDKAKKIVSLMTELFWDEAKGGFYFSPIENFDILLPEKKFNDSVIPSGNSVAAFNLLRLAHLTENLKYEKMAKDIVQYANDELSANPAAKLNLLIDLDYLKNSFKVVTLEGRSNSFHQKIISFVRENYLPDVLIKRDNIEQGNAQAYICRDYRCGLPTGDPDKIIEELKL